MHLGPTDPICGATFALEGVPFFTCTLQPHSGENVHRNADGWVLVEEDGSVQINRGTLVRRPLHERADRIADDLAALVRELRDAKAGTSEQRLRLAAAAVNVRMLADDVRAELAGVRQFDQTGDE